MIFPDDTIITAEDAIWVEGMTTARYESELARIESKTQLGALWARLEIFLFNSSVENLVEKKGRN